jgi:hypothetical protein
MMLDLVSNIFRGSVTAVMNVILLLTLAQPKFGRRSITIAAIVVFVVNLASSIWFYHLGDLTALSRFDVVLFIVFGLALKPLTKVSFMQWCFDFLTTINILMIIIVLSFHLGNLLPAPNYANTILRFGFYLLVILVFRRFLRPLYQPIINNWQVFLGLVVCVFINFAYYFYFTDDIKSTLSNSMWPLLLLVALSLSAYGTVFFSLKKIIALYNLETENLKMQNDSVLLSQAASTMAERLQLMEKVVYQNSLASHDRRHFNCIVLELLERGDVEEAMTCLRKQNAIKIPQTKIYCENKAINAVASYYIDFAGSLGIKTKVNLTIPSNVNVDSLELALVVSNLFENAINGVALLPEGQKRYINVTCLQVGRLLLEISNPCLESVTLDAKGYPFSEQEGHGIGTKSVIAFATTYDAELLYHVENGLFRVRLLV